MNICISCGKPVNNKYCNVSCQNKDQSAERNNKRFGNFKDFEVKCETCNNLFVVNERENLHPQKKNIFVVEVVLIKEL